VPITKFVHRFIRSRQREPSPTAEIQVDPVPCSNRTRRGASPLPRTRVPPWADTPWDRGFLVTPSGTRWPGTQATFLRFMVRAGGPLRTRARNPGPYRLLRGPGCYASPASLVRNSRLEKRSVVAAPASPMRRLPRLCRKTSWLESQGEKYTPGCDTRLGEWRPGVLGYRGARPFLKRPPRGGHFSFS